MLRHGVMTSMVLLAWVATAAGQEGVDICHRPPDNPSNTTLINVGQPALGDHLAHGDHLSFGGGCYVHRMERQRSSGAEQVCVDVFGGHLASVHSQAEDDFISALVDPNAVGGITAFIGGVAPGGFCAGPGGEYAWTDGSPWDFANWRLSTGEPNCSGAPAAVQFWPNTNGFFSGWNDIPASVSLAGFVCRYDPKN